jgi:hypothetical protein
MIMRIVVDLPAPFGGVASRISEHPAVLGVIGRQAEFGEDVADVLFHRAGRQHQPLGDGRIGVPLSHQRQQLPFPRGQRPQGTVPALPGQQLGNDLRVEHRSAAGDTGQGVLTFIIV